MTSVHSTPRSSRTAAASAASEATGTGYSGVLERPAPGASKLMMRRFGKYCMNGCHMSALQPMPGTRNSGSPLPSSETQIRCPCHAMSSRFTPVLPSAPGTRRCASTAPPPRGPRRCRRARPAAARSPRAARRCATASTPAAGAIVSFSADTDSTGIATAAKSTRRSPTVAVPFMMPFAPGPSLR